MSARGLRLMIVALFCVLMCMLATAAASVGATGTPFSSGGRASGQLEEPTSVAFNQATGNVYVGDYRNNRIDVFDESGTFLFAFGWDVNGASPAEEPQTCTTACQAGKTGASAGEFAEGPLYVTVDNDPLSLSYGDVYVADQQKHRVQKFTSSGEFLLMFGTGVNATTGKDVCSAGEACKNGSEGTADGQFDWAYAGPDEPFKTPQKSEPYTAKQSPSGSNYIAVGPGGSVYVGDKARIQIFEQTGVWRETISLAGLSSTDRVTELAVNAAGYMFVADGSGEKLEPVPVPSVREFAPNGTEMTTRFDVGSTTIDSLVLDGSGDLFVGDSSGSGFHILEYNSSSGVLLDSIAANLPEVGLSTAYSSTLGELYVSGFDERTPGECCSGSHPGYEPGVWTVTPPVSGPPTIEAVSATPQPRGNATLQAQFDPGAYETKYHFEYVAESEYEVSGYANAMSTPEASVTASLEGQSVSAALTGLSPGESYHYRLAASNSQSPSPVMSADQIFEETPAALVRGPWVTDVAGTSATFGAEVDPLGANTEYELEYGTSTAYGNTLVGHVGEGEDYVSIAGALHRQGLLPSTLYHYRLVTYSEIGTVIGTDHTFTTQVAGGPLLLPDGRTWELVSPPNKKGSLIEPFTVGLEQAASDGDGIAYLSTEAIGEGAVGRNGFGPSQILSLRSPSGWHTEDLALPHEPAPEGQETGQLVNALDEYVLFSPDLSEAVVEPHGLELPLSPEVNERTLYLRDDVTDTYTPLVRPANVTKGVRFGGEELSSEEFKMHILAATPDLSHVVLESPFPLTPESTLAPVGECKGGSLVEGFCLPSTEPHYSGGGGEVHNGDFPTNLYEWSAGRLRLVDMLPDGEPFQLGYGSGESARLGNGSSMVANAISDEGRWVVWETGNGREPGGKVNLYVRDMVAEKTYQIGGPHATFQTMSSDGSRVLFLENGELYEFDTETAATTDLTSAHSGETSAGVQDAILGASEDASRVYFVADGVLAAGAIGGQDNVYELSESAGAWTTTYVATLSGEDNPDWYPDINSGTSCMPSNSTSCPAILGQKVSRVSPDGQYLEFMSERSLTGYDNTDAVSGQPDEEVYLYDASAKQLACVSCDPTDARPTGLFDSKASRPLVDDAGTWQNRWIAGSVPGWVGPYAFGERSQHQPRFLSNDGRLFFDSSDALVPQDSNGVEDVYEYEPTGVGSCTAVSTTFSERSGGCVALISSGTSNVESAFLDASENGDDVFFLTESKLVPADYDASYDVYDAHVCGAEGVPCTVEPVIPPPCTSGDACKAAPSPQPEVFGSPPSATFSGQGNVIAQTTPKVNKNKKKSKAKKSKRKSKRSKVKGKSSKDRGPATQRIDVAHKGMSR